MRVATTIVLLSLGAVVGCGEGAAPATPIAADEPAAPSAPPAVAAEPTPPSDPVEPEEASPPPLTFAIPAEGRLPPLPQLPFAQIDSRGARWHEVRHPDPVARRRLAQLVEQLAYVAGRVPIGGLRDDQGGCRVRLATERVVAIECQPFYWDRGGSARPAEGRTAAHFVVDGSEVRPFALAEALREGRSWGDLADVPRCVAEVAPSMGMSRAPRFCRETLPHAQAVLTPRGIDLMVGHAVTISRPFAAVREHLREEGPIAWLFTGVDRPAPPSADAADGWSVGEVAPVSELAARFAGWPDALRATVRIADRTSGAGQPVVAKTAGYARAAAAARELGATARRATWESPALRLVRARLTEDEVLHSSSSHGRPLRALPAGTLVTVATSAPEGIAAPAERVQAATALRQTGWVRAGALAEHDGCVPDASQILAPIAADERAEAEERMTIASITVAARDATLFVTRAGGRTHARVETRTADCAPGEALFAVDVAGLAYDVRMTTTAPDGGGDAVLVLGLLRGRESRRYEAYHLASGERVLSHVLDDEMRDPDESPDMLRSVRFHEEEDGERWPLQIEEWRYRWSGRRFVDADPPG